MALSSGRGVALGRKLLSCMYKSPSACNSPCAQERTALHICRRGPIFAAIQDASVTLIG